MLFTTATDPGIPEGSVVLTCTEMLMAVHRDSFREEVVEEGGEEVVLSH